MKPMARTLNILAEPVGEEVVVYDRDAKKAHRLNCTAALVWRKCDGSRTVEDLAKIVSETLRSPNDEDFIFLTLEMLGKQTLLEGYSAENHVSRRDIIRKLRSLGIATALIPVVATIAAPPPAAAASRFDAPAQTTSPPDLFEQDPWFDTNRGPHRDPMRPWR